MTDPKESYIANGGHVARSSSYFLTGWQMDRSLKVATCTLPYLPYDALRWVLEDSCKALSDMRHAGPSFTDYDGVHRFLTSPFGDRPATHTPEEAAQAIAAAPDVEPSLEGAVATMQAAAHIMQDLQGLRYGYQPGRR